MTHVTFETVERALRKLLSRSESAGFAFGQTAWSDTAMMLEYYTLNYLTTETKLSLGCFRMNLQLSARHISSLNIPQVLTTKFYFMKLSEILS